MKENPNLKSYRPDEIKNLRIIGRAGREKSPLNLFWTGSGVELCTRGSELWVRFISDYSTLEPWISIYLNGTQISRLMLPAGEHELCVYRGFATDTANRIRILRESQAMPADEDCFVQIGGFRFDGEFENLPQRKYKLEFIGDSITSGEGLAGALCETQWLPYLHSVKDHYALLTAEALNAEYSILSQGGYGVLAGWDNNPSSAMPLYYEETCGVLHGEQNRRLGAFEKHDFAFWQPDAVIINLGTNDDGAFHQPAWRNPETGECFELRLNPDGSYNMEDIGRFVETAIDFLTVIRKNNPDAFIVWAYGMLGTPLWEPIQRAIDQYVSKSADSRVKLVRLPEAKGVGVGPRNHPGPVNHRQAAEALTTALKEILE